MSRKRPASYVDTCVLVSLFHADSGYGAAALGAADGLHLAMAHRQGLRLVSADQLLISAAHNLGIDAALVN